jgi:hypothetical protein
MSNEKSVPEILYHYTTQEGLLGILKEKVLWATNVHFLNDQSEFIYATDMLLRQVEPEYERYKLKLNALRKALVPINEQLAIERTKINEIIIKYYISSKIPIYVASFSKEGDQLGQWRGYCHNENGYSVGFDYAKLRELASEQKFSLVPCVYEESEQKSILSPLVSAVLKSLMIIDEAEESKKEEDNEWVMNVWMTAPTIKNEAFKEESEWRLVSEAYGTKEGRMAFRPGKSMIIPYINFSLGSELPIKEIIVGPTPDAGLSKKSISILKLAHNLKDAEIKISKVPYRTW